MTLQIYCQALILSRNWPFLPIRLAKIAPKIAPKKFFGENIQAIKNSKYILVNWQNLLSPAIWPMDTRLTIQDVSLTPTGILKNTIISQKDCCGDNWQRRCSPNIWEPIRFIITWSNELWHKNRAITNSNPYRELTNIQCTHSKTLNFCSKKPKIFWKMKFYLLYESLDPSPSSWIYQIYHNFGFLKFLWVSLSIHYSWRTWLLMCIHLSSQVTSSSVLVTGLIQHVSQHTQNLIAQEPELIF